MIQQNAHKPTTHLSVHKSRTSKRQHPPIIPNSVVKLKATRSHLLHQKHKVTNNLKVTQQRTAEIERLKKEAKVDHNSLSAKADHDNAQLKKTKTDANADHRNFYNITGFFVFII